MSRYLLLACLLYPAHGASVMIVNSEAAKDGYCIGHLDHDPNQWCWLTEDGKNTWVVDGEKWACRAFDGYDIYDYCENGKSGNPKLHQHEEVKADETTLTNSRPNKNGYCRAFAKGEEKWCWLTKDGKSKFAKEGKPWKCSSFDTYDAKDYCEKGQTTGSVWRTSKIDDGAATGIQKIVQSNVGKNQVDCKEICWYYGQTSYHRRWTSSGTTKDTTCTCGGNKKVVKVRCQGAPFTECTLQSSIGSAQEPKKHSKSGSGSSSKAAAGGNLGKFIAAWAKAQNGRKIGSDATHHRQTECWDLAMAAIEKAKKEGYHIAQPPGSYVWSTQEVPYDQALPGDIAQFVSWNEKVTLPSGAWFTRGTGPRHTAVVTRAFDSSSCTLEMYDQNPSPVSKSDYHPCAKYRLGGKITIYRLPTTSRLYEFQDWPVPDEFQRKTSTATMAVCAACLLAATSMAVASLRSLHRQSQGMVLLQTEDADSYSGIASLDDEESSVCIGE